jgi:hypothetical protein
MARKNTMAALQNQLSNQGLTVWLLPVNIFVNVEKRITGCHSGRRS